MRFIKSFRGARQGEAYPSRFAAGDECPIELEQAAVEKGAVDPNAADRPIGGPTGEVRIASSSPAGRLPVKPRSRKQKGALGS
nr:hypothetical protein 1 [Alphaproteobacteria bacterium]BDD46013.1 hypothetical protein 2 [Pseudomonadaceae bacterium]BDD46430.1 hypothetical protein 1 [bacterium]